MYTKEFILSIRAEPVCSLVPPELDYEFTFEKRTNPKTVIVPKNCTQGRKFQGRDQGFSQNRGSSSEFRKKVNSQFRQKISRIPIDTKHINAILNKLTETNYDKLLEETRTFDYSSPEIVSKIFKKVINEPCFAKLYSRLCKDLEEIHDMIHSMYTSEFNNNKSKNLMIFIGELFNVGMVLDIGKFTSELRNSLSDSNLELLCVLITHVGITNKVLSADIKLLRSVQNNYKSRLRFMILDIIEKI